MLKGEPEEKIKISIVNTPVLDDLKKKYFLQALFVVKHSRFHFYSLNRQSENGLDIINEENIMNFKSTNSQITTIKVKCDNSETYLLKLNYSDTIKDLKNYLKVQRFDKTIIFYHVHFLLTIFLFQGIFRQKISI